MHFFISFSVSFALTLLMAGVSHAAPSKRPASTRTENVARSVASPAVCSYTPVPSPPSTVACNVQGMMSGPDSTIGPFYINITQAACMTNCYQTSQCLSIAWGGNQNGTGYGGCTMRTTSATLSRMVPVPNNSYYTDKTCYAAQMYYLQPIGNGDFDSGTISNYWQISGDINSFQPTIDTPGYNGSAHALNMNGLPTQPHSGLMGMTQYFGVCPGVTYTGSYEFRRNLPTMGPTRNYFWHRILSTNTQQLIQYDDILMSFTGTSQTDSTGYSAGQWHPVNFTFTVPDGTLNAYFQFLLVT